MRSYSNNLAACLPILLLSGCLTIRPPAAQVVVVAPPTEALAIRRVVSAVPSEPQRVGEVLGRGVWLDDATWNLVTDRLQAGIDSQ